MKTLNYLLLVLGALALPSFILAQDRGLVPTHNKAEQTRAETARSQRPALVLQTGVTEPAAVLAFSPDGRLLASAGFSGQAVKVWEIATGRELLTLSASGQQAGFNVQLSDLVFSPGLYRESRAGRGWHASGEFAELLIGELVYARYFNSTYQCF